MARILSRAQVIELTRKYEPILQRALLEAFDEIKRGVDLAALSAALERGDIETAIKAIHLDPAAFRAYERTFLEAYEGGGTAAIKALPALRGPDGLSVLIRFDVRNIRAENWLRDHSTQFVTRIVEDQRDSIRQALVTGLERGANPRTTALDIVGRIDRTTGQRSGGIIGLSSAQERYVANARGELLSGNVSDLKNYLTRERRDRRFDGHVLKAIESGEGIDSDTVSRMITRYSDSLLELRGETIARTETMAALNGSREEAMLQAVDGGAVRAENVTKVWRSSVDNRVRETHRDMNGQTVNIRDKFVSASGAQIQFPGDPNAPIEEIANCRCYMETRIDFLADIE